MRILLLAAIVLLVLMLSTSIVAATWAEKVQDAQQQAAAVGVIIATLATLGGVFLKNLPSHSQAKVIEWQNRAMAAALFLQGDKFKLLMDTVAKMGSGRVGQKEAAVKLLLADTQGTPHQMSKVEAEKFVGWLYDEFDQGAEWLKDRLGRR